jgi:hypothetical protein
MSQITGICKDYVENLFPKNFFKEVYITTSNAFTDQAGSTEENGDPKVLKIPRLSISPEFLFNSSETFGWGSAIPTWRRGIHLRYRDCRDYGYKRIFRNEQDDININTVPNRVKFVMYCKVRTDTFLSKLDVGNYLQQRLSEGDRFYLNNKVFESEIPYTIIKAISAIKGLDFNDNDDQLELDKYLKRFSSGQITHKTNQATGNKIYSFLYSSNILVTVSNPPTSDGRVRERINMSDDSGEIEFNLDMEFWIPNNYLLECNAIPQGDYNPLSTYDKVTFEHFVPMRPPDTIGERTQIAWNKFVTETNVKMDYIEFGAMLSKNVNRFILERSEKKDYAILKDIFEIVIFRDDRKLEEGKDYRIEWKKLRVEMIQPLFNYVYNIGIYAKQDELFDAIEKKVTDNTVKTF